MPSALPVIPWRLILVGIAGIAVLLILICGIRALYRATSAKPAVETVATASEEQPAAKAAPRTQQDIPSLYID